jgi:hypothetical protein
MIRADHECLLGIGEAQLSPIGIALAAASSAIEPVLPAAGDPVQIGCRAIRSGSLAERSRNAARNALRHRHLAALDGSRLLRS